jgi:hypothetical protein
MRPWPDTELLLIEIGDRAFGNLASQNGFYKRYRLRSIRRMGGTIQRKARQAAA